MNREDIKEKIAMLELELKTLKRQLVSFKIGEKVVRSSDGAEEEAYVLVPSVSETCFYGLMEEYAFPQILQKSEWTSNGEVNEELIRIVKLAAKALEGAKNEG